MKKAIPFLIAVILIIGIGAALVGTYLAEKYSYSQERADLDEYFGVSGDRLAIVLQDEVIEEQAILRGGSCYFDLDTVSKYFTDGFYADTSEGLLLYTTATQTHSIEMGRDALYEDGTVYVAADYVRKFSNFSIDVFDRHVQVYTQWSTRSMDTVTRDTAVRLKGGIKSPILCDLAEGDQVEILEPMETWCKVKTQDSIIGYVEIKELKELSQGRTSVVDETPVDTYVAPEYTGHALEGKVSLGWHSIGGVGGNATLEEMVAGTKGMNVIAPTWFSINDEEGGFRSLASADYVERAHQLGLEVWGVWDDFNYNNETGAGVSIHKVLSSTSVRQRLVENIVGTAKSLGLDGVNLDFEKISEETGVHYVQFLRELSVACRQEALTLSIDNYVPYDFRTYYRLDVQGQVADYVIIMGYDEHWHGSGSPGSVASLGYVTNGLDKALEKVPAEKLVNALPFYTILWKTEGVKVTDDYITMNNQAGFVERMKITPEWDEESGQNYAEWKSGEATYQVWLEDEKSIAAKLSVMSARKIAGVAVWRLGYGTDAVWNLLNSYVNQ